MSQTIVIKPSMKDNIIRGFQSIEFFASEFLEIELHDDQILAASQMRLKDEFALVTGNRWGKGDLMAVIFAWLGAYKPVDSRFKDVIINMLNTSISQDQANIIFTKFEQKIVGKPKYDFFIKDIKKSPFPHVEFNSKVTWWVRNASYGGKYLEGFSFFFANFDEADLQEDFKKFYEDILAPRLWDYAGASWYCTTPRRGKANSFKIWDTLLKKQKNDGIVRTFQGDSRNNTCLPQKSIDKMNKLPLRLFNKNVLGLYDDSEGSVASIHLQECQLKAKGICDIPNSSKFYVNAWDFARKSTYNVGLTIEVSGNDLQLVSWERMRDTKKTDTSYWKKVREKMALRNKKWRGITVADATGIGDVILDDLPFTVYPIILAGKIQSEIISFGMTAIENAEIGLPLEQINQIIDGEYWSAYDELSDFDPQYTDSIIWDFVCTLFMGIWYIKTKPNLREKQTMLSPLAVGVSKYA
jgi:hypothetical protein